METPRHGTLARSQVLTATTGGSGQDGAGARGGGIAPIHDQRHGGTVTQAHRARVANARNRSGTTGQGQASGADDESTVSGGDFYDRGESGIDWRQAREATTSDAGDATVDSRLERGESKDEYKVPMFPRLIKI